MDHETQEIKFTTRGAFLGLIAYLVIVLIVVVFA